MSNYLAIATVTAALKRILADIDNDIPGVEITTQPLDTLSKSEKDGLNILLYQVTTNNGYTNMDLPARNSKGELVKKPQLGLNLHYLFTAYSANNDELQSHKILASAMRILHETPLLSRNLIEDTIKANTGLTGSDLAEQIETVKLTYESLSLEDIAKLWSSFLQTPYRLSVSYQASVVLLDSKERPKESLPVKERMIYVLPFKQPIITKIEDQIVESADNASITIIGRNLKSERVSVQIGNIYAPPDPNNISDSKITIAIPTNLPAGIKPLQVIHELQFSSPDPYKIYRSNVVAFVLAPKILSTSSVVQGSVSIKVRPKIEPNQKVELLLDDNVLAVKTPDESESTDTISVTIPSDILKGGQRDFLVRIRVDGAESFLERDSEKFVGPVIKVTA